MSLIDIRKALIAISADRCTPNLKCVCENLLKISDKTSVNVSSLIDDISHYILSYEDVLLIKKHLSHIVLALVSARIPLKPLCPQIPEEWGNREKEKHVEFSIILSLLCDHPDIEQYTLKYLELNPVPPFEVYPLEVTPACKRQKLEDYRINNISDIHLAKCCYKLLTKYPNQLSAKWNWAQFIDHFKNNTDTEIRWMVKECMTIIGNLSEAQSKTLSHNFKVTNNQTKYLIAQKTNVVACREHVPGEMSLSLSGCNVVDISGIFLPICNPRDVQPGTLVLENSTKNNLRSLALAVASGVAVSLLGPVGSGKSSLVEHLSAVTGRHQGTLFYKLQLGDQIDSRMLLGSHHCTDVPGEFLWKPGVLTRAVQRGDWLLLEDIDCATLDVASTLSSLLERRSLSVPGYRDCLPVAPGFQLFVTQRTIVTSYGYQKKMSTASTLLQKQLTQINVEPLSRSELKHIIQIDYPILTTICSKMVEVYMLFSVGNHDTSLENKDIEFSKVKEDIAQLKGSRLISTRDLKKWCSRAVVGYIVTSPESALRVLQDALDLFTCSVASSENRLQLSKTLGIILGLVETKTEYFCNSHKPKVSLNPMYLEVGRAQVPRLERSLGNIDLDKKTTVFSFTRPSACLLERIACCVVSKEPVLLVGETGTGKTSSVQYLARQTGHDLTVINMNQQSDSADLLGGYKPVDMKYVIKPIKNEYLKLFRSLFNIEKNQKFVHHIESSCERENWTVFYALIEQSYKAALNRLTASNSSSLPKWLAFGSKLSRLEKQIKAETKLTFAFIEGSLLKAMREGRWVLLDEINLASADILECLAGLLEDQSLELFENSEKVVKDPNFTLFACMNPATDVGKKDLPAGLRNRFTEFFIDELTDTNNLMTLVGDYLYHMNLDRSVLSAICDFYINIKKRAHIDLVDGSENAPHYSLRTLCRALSAAAKANCGTVLRSLYEAFCLSFLTQLDHSSHPKVEAMIEKAIFGKKDKKSFISQEIPRPQLRGQHFLKFEGHWIAQGHLEPAVPEGYILTPTVRKNLRDIARIISIAQLPILLQGDTSVGKTSLITYIAKASGNYCVRINNHEHTDLQEYIGSYASNADGKLVFREGVLVEAMRKGYWLILDELNLAPSDVLEALNRVLDDNRELFIPETQKVVKANPHFMLFATQNPPGLYGGRKMLSRAFRNRFVELHFDDIPKTELVTILDKRCHVPTKYCRQMIEVMSKLQAERCGSATVQGKRSFITLRDLFRWGQRYRLAEQESFTNQKFYDWDQHIADEGYLILAGRVRHANERVVIKRVIETHFSRSVDPNNLFTLHEKTSPVTKQILEEILNSGLEEFSHVVWTFNMRRLAVLMAKSFTFKEPVLLVGETGCGKTTICQVLAALRNTNLLTVNCHMHTESADFLGGLRPVRHYQDDGRLFEWVDGSLITAMEKGYMFLADEISLADDSVLERLNSLLEPERQLVLAERGTEEGMDSLVVTAHTNFHFIGTMNPGGDFGKKELSPALRNRFTEVWCDNVTSREDLLEVLEKSVHKGISLGNHEDGYTGIGNCILDFTDWLKKFEVTSKFPFSIRDLLSWVNFINVTVFNNLLPITEAYVHGACMTFLDCFGTALTGNIAPKELVQIKEKCIDFVLKQMSFYDNEGIHSIKDTLLGAIDTSIKAESISNKFGIRPFYVDIGKYRKQGNANFAFTAPTTGANALRLLRGLQLNKAILLEGNPGVGKTSLVTALAIASGHKVVRINLSDQTDISDLFGTDLPSEDGSFVFKEGIFLKALQNGDWILLDELNLAPQPVLEGLNACLDHRGEVYIPELGQTFKIREETRLFACQNPLKQGGARRGLPISFLNRFTQVYIDVLTQNDLFFIVESQYQSIPKDILHRIVKFNCRVADEICNHQIWGHRGSPWELNLRDILRWCDALYADKNWSLPLTPGKFVGFLYVNRMRTSEDKRAMTKIYDEIFLPQYPRSENYLFSITENEVIFGDVTVKRNYEKSFKNKTAFSSKLFVLRNQIPIVKALAQSIRMNWLSILVGSNATGKSSVVQVLADLTGNQLEVVPVTSAMDISDLLGGFEQIDYNRNLEILFDKIETLTMRTVKYLWINDRFTKKHNDLLNKIHEVKLTFNDGINSEDLDCFKRKIKLLLNMCQQLLDLDNIEHESVSKLIALQEHLTLMEHKFATMTNAQTGGKFQWIDSVLVKAMMEGSWLLLDNVNMTSAAVLDRLNGLLESEGTLSIPERGDVQDIVPHKDFRIFFTMDPKFGEISRAMRNRGVEIFVLRHDEVDSSQELTMPRFDLYALLNSCGLSSESYPVFKKAHNLLSSYIYGLEKPTLSHMLQAAELTWQQIVRGTPHNVALINSFSDVYIKSRCGVDFVTTNVGLAEMKNYMLNSLTNLINKYYIEIITNSNHTLSVSELCKHSSLELIKQIAYPATFDPNNDKNIVFDILMAYNKCPRAYIDDLDIVIKSELFRRDCIDLHSTVSLSIQLNEDAKGLASKLENCNYKRYYDGNISLEDQVRSNSTFLSLYFKMMLTFDQTCTPTNEYSALRYARTVMTRDMVDTFSEFSILHKSELYTNLINMLIFDIFKQHEGNKSDEMTCKLIQLLNWKRRFYRMCNTKIITTRYKKRPTLIEETLTLLHLHNKWMKSKFINVLIDTLPASSYLIQQYNERVLQLDIRENYFQSGNKISKKLRKIYGQPKLHENAKFYQLTVAIKELYSSVCLDLNRPLMNCFKYFSIANESANNYGLSLDVPDIDTFRSIQHMFKYNSIRTDKKNSKISNPEIKLLPFIDYIVIKAMRFLENDLLVLIPELQKANSINVTLSYKNAFKVDFVNVIRSLIDVTKGSIGFSLELISLFELLLKLMESPSELTERASSFTVKFWHEFYKKLLNSPARKPDRYYNDKSSDVAENIVSYKTFSTNSPLLPYFVQKVLIADSSYDVDYSLAHQSVKLQDWELYSNQLATYQDILWKNIGFMNLSSELKLRSDAILEIRKYEQLMIYIHLSTTNNNYAEVIYSDELFDKVLQILNNLNTNKDKTIIKMIEKAHSARKELKYILSKNDKNNTAKVLTHKVSLLVSLIFGLFIADISEVDIVEKHKLKLNYINEDIKMFDTILSSYYIQGVVDGSIDEAAYCDHSWDVKPEYYDGAPNREKLERIHPFCKIFLRLKEETAEKVKKYSQGNTFRPQEPSYRNFAKDCKYFLRSVLSTQTITEIVTKLSSVADVLTKIILRSEFDNFWLEKSQTVYREIATWIESLSSFYIRVENEYAEAFPDLGKPLLYSLSQILNSVTNMNDLIKELSVKMQKGPEFSALATELIVFPNVMTDVYQSRDSYMNRFINPKMMKLLGQNVDGDNRRYITAVRTLELLKMNLSELSMQCYCNEEIDSDSLDSIVMTLNAIVKTWDDQRKAILQKKEDDDALYVTRSKCDDVDEETLANQEISEMFPSFSDNDFSEFRAPTLEQVITPKKQDSENKGMLNIIKSEDISLVYKWHNTIVTNLTCTEWLRQQFKLSTVDFAAPFVQRYSLFSGVIQENWEVFDSQVEGKISPSLLLLLARLRDSMGGKELPTQRVDFYRSPWVVETKKCLPLLAQVKETTNDLLDRWPDFPSLKDIMLIVNRILDFSLQSPVARYITGLELLRDKIEEWNKQAHSGNNMINISLLVGQQIVNWRKLEMAHWKDSLNNLLEREESVAHKFWFHLYTVVSNHIEGTENMPAEVLTTFMEKSNLVEFQVKLNIIYTFHCHLVHLKKCPRRDEMIKLLWNVHNYYNQFSTTVATYLKEKRAPIEKKLKDFVKISSWDRDLSYWSVKDTVDKAHKVLHKHTKEFEKLVRESVSVCLVIQSSGEEVTEHVGIWDRPKRVATPKRAPTPTGLTGGAYLIELSNHMVSARAVKKYLDQAQETSPYLSEHSLLTKVPALFKKAKRLCRATMSNTNYPTLVQGLDDFVTQVIETSKHLGNLQVDLSAPKKKQTSQASSIVQQKRKALADLFRYLSRMGLNYNTGNVIIHSHTQLYDFTLEPVNLDAAICYLKSRRCDPSLSLLWSGCEKYFLRNWSRHRSLSAALLSPHPQLGLHNLQRCKGFAAVLLDMTNKQKKSISICSRQLCDLRNMSSHMTAAFDVNTRTTNLLTLDDQLLTLNQCHSDAILILEQYGQLLLSCPNKELPKTKNPQFDTVLSNSPIVNCYQKSEEWNALSLKVRTMLVSLRKHKSALQKLKRTMPNVLGKDLKLANISQLHIDAIINATNNLAKINKELENILEQYQFKFKTSSIEGYTPTHPMLHSLAALSQKFDSTIKQIQHLQDSPPEPMEEDNKNLVKDFSKQTEDIIASMLLVIQSLYKTHLAKKGTLIDDDITIVDDAKKALDSSKEEPREILEESHLKSLIQDKLTNDVKMLQLDCLIGKTTKLYQVYVHNVQVNREIGSLKDIGMRVVPILEQLIHFVQYFVTQQVAIHRVSCKMLSVLLKIFSDLCTKGFCKPSDLDDGEGEEGSGHMSSGTGLGEGEGQKDVSERIENQDQLDDAKRPGEEKKDEDRDCKEEESGVNMTDDFDSHLQDVDKKEGEESDEDKDDDDADKQMGETDNAAEKLDQQIWGSEDEEEEEEESNNKDVEEKGKGESTGEKEMSARDKEQGTDDGDKGKERKEKKDINEMKEPEIDDDHIDPYNGNHQPLPEPKDYEIPDNLDADGKDDDMDGETETENPFEIDITKDDIPDNNEEDDGKQRNDEGLQVSSDEEGEDGDEGKDDEGNADKHETPQAEKETDKDNDKEDEKGNEEEDGTTIQDEAQKDTEPEKPEDQQDEENISKNPDKIDEEDKKEERKERNPEANPSNDDQSQQKDAENAEMETGTDDNVQTNPDQKKDEEAEGFEQAQEQVGDDRQATGRSELDKSERGHRGQKQKANRPDTSAKKDKHRKQENKPGKTEQERTLGEVTDKKQKKSHTLNVEKEDATEEGGEEVPDEDQQADAYQHVKQAKKDDIQTIDAATKEQAEQQPTLQREQEEAEEMGPDDEVPMEVDDDDLQVEKCDKEIRPEKSRERGDLEEKRKERGEEGEGDTAIQVDGEQVRTHSVARGHDNTYHTRLDPSTSRESEMSLSEYNSHRSAIGGAGTVGRDTCGGLWRGLWGKVGAQARGLADTLRLILTPTTRSRLAGEYRTGRRLNMRRVIPYIASQFRKDRIWLRRSKPAQRDYKIAIAIDDSKSMDYNDSKDFAFQSLALVSQALNLLESGDLSVLSYGAQPTILHPFCEPFSEHSGAKIIEKLTFSQDKTRISQLLDFATVMFDEQTVSSDAINAKLLVIIGDGQGVNAEGPAKVLQAVRRLRQKEIFVVYVIIDNPENKCSVLDIRNVVTNVSGKSSSIMFRSFMESFPFPFYVVVRDLTTLPSVLGDALRQWFELAANCHT